MTLLNEKRYSPVEAAKKLRMSRRTLDKAIGSGAITVIRHSARHIEVPESSLEAYLQALLKASKKTAKKKPQGLKAAA